MISRGIQLAGTIIGGPQMIAGRCLCPPYRFYVFIHLAEMLQLAVDKGVKSWVEERPMKEASQALKDMRDGKARCELDHYVIV